MLTIIESPFAGHPQGFAAARMYACAACRDAIQRQALIVPFASHLLYPQWLNELDPSERDLGLDYNFWMIQNKAEQLAFYLDYGVSEGMKAAAKFGRAAGLPMFARFIRLESHGFKPQAEVQLDLETHEWMVKFGITKDF